MASRDAFHYTPTDDYDLNFGDEALNNCRVDEFSEPDEEYEMRSDDESDLNAVMPQRIK